MNRRIALILILVLVGLIVIVGGCGRQETQPPPPPAGNGDGTELDINALTAQWVESDHSNVLISAAGREGCVVCHDGGAFADNVTDPAELNREFSVAIDCRACHVGQGVELMEAGTVNIPTQENVQAGLGAQCLFCHNERRAPDITDENRSAPHYSSQAGVFTGTGGIRAEGFDYGSTTAHVNVDDTCVACHMTPTEGGWAGHTFRVDDIQAACGSCHQGIQDFNLQANADYDGDGNTAGFMDEVEGLLVLLEEAINAELDGGTFQVGQGRIQFRGADDEEMAVEDEVYMAAYNYVLVVQDGSLGLHNPIYAVQLLQQSYRVLTGEDVPNAEIR